jgi:hypothetical protein
MDQFTIIEFYLDLVRRAQERGICCAITSGMACVAYEVAEATKDCDLLCDPEMDEKFLALLAESPLGESGCRYRGNISPPLDARWHRGGWTSHFEWPGTEAFLDVFGIAPRARSAWQEEMRPPYAHPHVVADMKRTARTKDWPFISDLGALMLAQGDQRGWLHLFDAELLKKLASKNIIPPEIIAMRPTLGLINDAVRLTAALAAEEAFWRYASEARIKFYERPLKRYVFAVRKAEAGQALTLLQQHEIRLTCAELHLPPQPLGAAEFDEMVAIAKQSTLALIHPSLEDFLPDMRANYRILVPNLL